MTNLSLKQKIMIAVAIIGAALIAIFRFGFYTPPKTAPIVDKVTQNTAVVSTDPSPLEDATILPTQTISVSFNLPLEGSAELKLVVEPEAKIKVELSDDRKTAKITPINPYSLGQGYTLKILPDTKFDGKKRLEVEKIFHFKTIQYRGA
ncbi:Ig-like domain-containing protein [Candidatus Daviesbacteria bacterium]|nr:Ig-like domain-containing protein [Candidatus Daviesbacteria bacterium]